MDVRRNHASTSVRTEGGLLPTDLLEKIRAADPDVPGLRDADFGLAAGERAREATTRSWNRLVGAWAALEAVRVGAEASDPLVGPTRDRFLLPLFEELGFGRLPVARAVEIEGASYPISHSWEGRVPVHLVGYGVELDSRTKGVRGAAGAAPHALVQEYLNRADEALWGVVSNGCTLRLLRDSTSFTRQAYVEFDLEAIFEGELYADFALLWSVLHRSRFEGEKPADCLLERWTKKAADDGTRALEKLRGGVEKAIETLGAGFLATKGNGALVEALRSGELDSQDYYRELLRLVYRLIFLFTAEDRRDEDTGRELLLDPAAPEEAAERYRRYYSTVRLRSFAGRRRGSRHPDLWVSLRRVVAALGSDGAPSLALPALGSFLFGSEACRHLDASELTNEALLDAVRALATIEEDRRLRLVDYRNLGAEELGGIYEGLLELHPRIELDAIPPRFSLATAAGNERKSTGSYYTPTSLIGCLLDSALDPVVDEAVRGRSSSEAEAAILGLAVVDPAAGSGHFLIAAAHRLAKRLAAVRSGEGEPPPTQVRRALREVISRCIYAVDINPLAVELCKLSLWLEALEPGKPLSFLDAHIKTGNSLLGTTPELAAAGLPDAAFEAITGDDKAVARDWRKANSRERAGQYSLFGAGLVDPVASLAQEAHALEVLPEDSTKQVTEKAARHHAYLESPTYVTAKATLDAWCAAFVAPKVPGAPSVTTSVVQSLAVGGERASSAARELAVRTAVEYGFFHWPVEFPAVFGRGGFDVVVGNPPWERVKLEEREFFAQRSPQVAAARNAADRKRMIAALREDDPSLWRAFQAALRVSDGESHILRNSMRYPLTGRGDINTYAVFAELASLLIGRRGRVGVILPTGIATDDTTKFFFQSVVEGRRIASLYGFENEEFVFPGIAHTVKFCLLTLTGLDVAISEMDFVYFARGVDALHDPDRHFTLSSADVKLLNPNTRTSPIFRSRADAEMTKLIYQRVPVLIDESLGDAGNSWNLSFLRMFDMANDSSWFRSSDQLAAAGWSRQGNTWQRDTERYVPLYEAKMALFFDHRFGDFSMHVAEDESKGIRALPEVPESLLSRRDYFPTPRYWVPDAEVEARVAHRWPHRWLLGWREVTSAVLMRTLSPSLIPRYGTSHKILLAMPGEPPYLSASLFANLASFALDFVARQKLGGNSFSYFFLKQLPVLAPNAYLAEAYWATGPLWQWVVPRVVELTCVANDLLDFASDLGWAGPPFMWNSGRRSVMRAELDAAFFLLYGFTREDVARTMDTFWVVRDRDRREHGAYRTKELILDAYEAMAAATPEHPYTSRLDPAPGDPIAAHPPRPGEGRGHWAPWSEVVTRTAQVAPPAPPDGRSLGPTSSPTSARQSRALEPVLSLFAPDPRSTWQPEAGVAPTEIVMGARVRHRAKGEGTVLSLRASGKSTELLVRFDAVGETWIAFGYGTLEFMREE